MGSLIAIAIGGAGGAMARYLLSAWVGGLHASMFPYGTLLVNVLGSLLIGGMYVLSRDVQFSAASAMWFKPLVVVGFLGAFTTFSAFSLDTITLLENDKLLLAFGNVLISVLSCLFACWVGIVAARRLLA